MGLTAWSGEWKNYSGKGKGKGKGRISSQYLDSITGLRGRTEGSGRHISQIIPNKSTQLPQPLPRATQTLQGLGELLSPQPDFPDPCRSPHLQHFMLPILPLAANLGQGRIRGANFKQLPTRQHNPPLDQAAGERLGLLFNSSFSNS